MMCHNKDTNTTADRSSLYYRNPEIKWEPHRVFVVGTNESLGEASCETTADGTALKIRVGSG